MSLGFVISKFFKSDSPTKTSFLLASVRVLPAIIGLKFNFLADVFEDYIWLLRKML